MEKKLLSITIPTYNRDQDLKRCLDSIYIQIQDTPELNDLVEIVIADNCSPDNTEEVASFYKDKFNNFVYVRNENNVGFDNNTYIVVNNASSSYCWYLGDDDVIQRGGLQTVVNKLKDHKYDVVTVEARPILEKYSYKNIKVYSESTFLEIEDGNEFYFKGYCQGGFSVLIFNREMWMSAVDTNDYLVYWLYYETVLKILMKTSKSILYIQEPVIITGQDCRWAENGTELFTFINSNLLMEKMITFGFDKERLTKELNTNSQKILIMILRAKGHGLKMTRYNLAYIHKNLPYAKSWRIWIATLIFFVPNFLIVWVRDIKKYINKKNK